MFSNYRYLFILFLWQNVLLIQANTTRQYHEIRNFISNTIPVENQNWSICQHPGSGYVYFANSEGLIEFDGLVHKVYKLPYNKGLRSVGSDKDGLIFSGGFEEFGFWENNNGCKLVYHSLSKSIGVENNDEIWKIYCRDNKVYFQSFTSIYVYDYKSVKKIKAQFTQLFMYPVKLGFVVQILGTGLFNFENEKYTFIPGSEQFATQKVLALIPFKKDSYLLGSANNGLYVLEKNKIIPFPCETSDFLKYNTCNGGVAINDSLFVFGTILNGIVECDSRGTIKKTINFSNGLINNTVLSLYKDRDNGLWVGLDQGVNYLEMHSPIVQYTNVTGTLGTIYTLLKKDNLLYLGTNQGLFTAKINKLNSHYSFSDVQMVTGSQGQVWTLREFDGQVLCGHNDGTFLVKDNNFIPISDITGGWSLKPINNYLIEGTYTGLVLFQKDNTGVWKFRNKVIDYNEPSRHVEVDYLGYVWASHHQRGIYKIELNDGLDSVVTSQFFNNIAGSSNNIDVFKINNRIIFTGTDQLYTFDYDASRIVPFKSLNSQLGEFKKATQIIPHTKNQYWFVFDNKIALFEVAIDFKIRKILEFIQKNIHSPGNDLEIITLDDQNILFPNHQGFVLYNANNSNDFAYKTRISVASLVFQGKGKTIEMCSNSAKAGIPFYMNNLTVYFSDPSRFNMEEKVYYYRIPEIEDQWHVSTINNFNYNNLRFGKYTVQIKSDLNTPVVESVFSIRPPWYLTYLAFFIYMVLLSSLGYLGYRIFIYELRKQKKLLEMEIRGSSLESELDIKSNELMLTMRYLIQKNEILTELKEEIDALKEHSSKYPIKHVKNLEKIVYQGLDTQTENWKTAMNNLKLSQQGFFRRLKEKHTDLTPNDLRLCSYLRMNFTTKEIAHLLNISGRGVEIGRYRLRKKMNLAHDINLSEYLMKEEFGELKGIKKS